MKKLFTFLAFGLLCMAWPQGVSADVTWPVTIDGVIYETNGATTCEASSGRDAAGDVTIPSTVNGYTVYAIASGAFAGNTAITSVAIPETVEYIQSDAFANCTALTSVSLPKGITEIYSRTFIGCTALTKCDIPEGVTNIDGYAFSRCHALAALTLPSTVKELYGESQFYQLGDNTGGAKLTCLATTPPKASEYAFDSFSGTIAVPAASLEAYKEAAGWISVASRIEAIAEPSWPITIDGVTYSKQSTGFGFAVYVVASPDAAGDVTIEATVGGQPVTYIAANAFKDNGKITSVVVPESVREIEEGAFMNCTSLTKVSLPKGISIIEPSLFEGCTALKECNVPEGVYHISTGVFRDCLELTSLTLPATVKYVNDRCFFRMGENGTATLTCLATTPPEASDDAFDLFFGKVAVPAASLEAYKAAEGWSAIASQIEAIAEPQPAVEIVSDYDTFNCAATTANYINVTVPVFVREDGKRVTLSQLEADGSITFAGDIRGAKFVDRTEGQVYVSGPTVVGTSSFTVSYKGVERTFTFNRYNCEVVFTPAGDISMAVGEEKKVSVAIAFSGIGSESFELVPSYANVDLVDATTMQLYEGEAVTATDAANVITVSATAVPDRELELAVSPTSISGNTARGWFQTVIGISYIPVTVRAKAAGITIESDYEVFNFFADGKDYKLPVDVYEDGKRILWSDMERTDVTVVCSGSGPTVEGGFNATGPYVVANAACSGTVTVSYKDVERTFKYNFYTGEFVISPIDPLVAVGESVTFLSALRFTNPIEGIMTVTNFDLNGNVDKNGTWMDGVDEYFKLEFSGNSMTLTVLADPGEGEYSIYTYANNIDSNPDEYWAFPVYSAIIPFTIARSEAVVLAVALPNGAVNITDADKRETPLSIVADEGWKISTVTLGGDDITSELGDGGAYTVPALTESKALNVVFVQDTQTAVADLDADMATPKVYAAGGEVRIEGAEPGAEVRVYDLAGRCLKVTTDHVFPAPGQGVRILTVAGRTYKFAL